MSDDVSQGFDRITVSMPSTTAQQLREAVKAGAATSVSALVAEAVADRLAREHSLQALADLRGRQPLPEYALVWARKALGVEPASESIEGRPEGKIAS